MRYRGIVAADPGVEDGVAEGEDPTVGSHQPVALAVDRRGNSDDRRVPAG